MIDSSTQTMTAPLAVDARTAAAMLSLSVKTLERAAARGEAVGRIKVGRRIIYRVDLLQEWLHARSDENAKRAPHHE